MSCTTYAYVPPFLHFPNQVYDMIIKKNREKTEVYTISFDEKALLA